MECLIEKNDKMALAMGERVQMQQRDGRIGKGIIILDVPAPIDLVYETLSQFDR